MPVKSRYHKGTWILKYCKPSGPERWKRVVGYESLYKVSTWGRLKSLGRWKWNGNEFGWQYLPPKIHRPTSDGKRMLVNLTDANGKKRTRNLARLVLEAFVGPCPKGLEACHFDGKHENNTLDNLRWDTHESNEGDKKRHGTDNSGERNGSAKSNPEEVREIRRLHATGKYSYSKLAKMFGLTLGTLHPMVTRKTWKNVD